MILSIWIGISPFSAQAAGVRIDLSPKKDSYTVGELVTVSGTVTSGNPIYGVVGGLSYNPAVLQYVSGGSVSADNEVKITDTECNGETHRGYSITFKVIGAGDCYLRFSAEWSDGSTKESGTGGYVIQTNSPPVLSEDDSFSPIADFLYQIADDGLCITGYTGQNSSVKIAESYSINGINYKVARIDELAFESTTITDISLPQTVLSVGNYAFFHCTSLKRVALWNKYAVIGLKAFGYSFGSEKINGLNLVGYYGSTLQDYATENGMSFEILNRPVGKGDLTGKGEISISDLIVMRWQLLNIVFLQDEYFSAADINDDHVVDIKDMLRLKKLFLR